MAKKPTYEELEQRVKELEKEALKLRQVERNLRIMDSAVASSINAIGITDLQGKLIYVNDSCVKMWGYDNKDEILGRLLLEFWEGEGIINTIKELREKGVVAGEDVGKRKDGSLFDVEFTASMFKEEAGDPSYMFGSFFDITDRKRTEEALQRAQNELEQRVEERTAELLKANEQLKQEINERKRTEEALRESAERLLKAQRVARMGFLDWNLKTNEMYWSDEIYNLYGIDPKEQKSNIDLTMELVHPDDREIIDKKLDMAIKEGKKYDIDHRILRPDGEVIWVHAQAELVSDKNGNLERMLGSVVDITDRKILETQLQQAQKMESIGTLAGGIAHDFNNILTPIMIHADMVMEDLPPDSPLQNNLNQIFQAGEHARDLVKQILTFSRQRDQERIALKLGLIVKEIIKLFRSTFPTTIEIYQDIQTESDTVLADPTQINQILMNLCTNASHAMRETGGELTVTLFDEQLDSETAGKFSDLNPGSYLRLTVRDTGHGMGTETVNRVFEPYFTTKAPGEGTGMGLAMVHGIVKSYGGDITVESEPGKGTTFNILLPKIEADVSSVEEHMVEIPKGTENILFVDDEKPAIDAVQPMLENLGYKVTARTSSIEALEAFRNNPEGFDLVITDMTMPNMTGKELAKEMMSIRSDIPIILCTGFSEQIDEREAKKMGISAYVMKPIVMREIANTIREVLDEN